ncbi:MAG TPA: TonB-dependent receptor [Vicinamibacterales bacterium]|nr:TonB-dependent receptor [Vicinamibacterales bacterium]
MSVRLLAAALLLSLASATAFAQTGTQQPPPKPEEPPVYEEQVVVTASKVEQQLVNAPATVSVVTADVIASTPATNYAELFKSVPGVNVSQTSARDFNITMRGAASTLATSTLALLDGRSLYLDFFGFVAWDLLPVNPNELKQIEVIRGPASAVWGANAMNGVVNFISKTPRELNGNSATMTFGTFGRDIDGGQQLGNGALFGINGTHARAVNDRWAYKLSAGGYTSDPYARPTGAIPNGTGTQYPNYTNTGTTQPKFDARVDYDQEKYKLVFAGGYSGTDGIFHTGIGPFDGTGVGVGYGTMRYTRGGLKFNVFTNILNGEALGLLAIGTDGQPILFQFNTKTYDVEFGNINTVGTRNVISYGGNVRFNSFDLSIAPRGDSRTELGGYIQDEIFLNDKVRISLGARLDKYDNIEDPVFSPRATLILKPNPANALRVSYNKAFRSPSLINNFLETTIINRVDLAQINPAFAGLPGRNFAFPLNAVGNEGLSEESNESYEIAYTGIINNRATVSAAVYWTKSTDEIFFTQTGRYRALAPPPNWLQTFSPGGTPILPPQQILGILEVLPPACASPVAECTTGGLPSEFSYRNLGTVKNKGFELGVDGAVSQALNVFVNYSYQAEPEPDFALSEINLPPTNRFNAGLNFSQGHYLGNLSVSFVDDAFFQDVLDARFAGPTEAYTQVNGAFGVKFLRDKLQTTIKVINLLDEDIQSHVFGDIMKRQIIGEVRVTF